MVGGVIHPWPMPPLLQENNMNETEDLTLAQKIFLNGAMFVTVVFVSTFMVATTLLLLGVI